MDDPQRSKFAKHLEFKSRRKKVRQLKFEAAAISRTWFELLSIKLDATKTQKKRKSLLLLTDVLNNCNFVIFHELF